MRGREGEEGRRGRGETWFAGSSRLEVLVSFCHLHSTHISTNLRAHLGGKRRGE